MPTEASLRSSRQPFNEIRLLNKHAVKWRFISKMNRWEIAAFNGSASEVLKSVTGEEIQVFTKGGPGTEEFSEALGLMVLSASLKIQSKRIDGRLAG